jgi:hypothetical protein
MGRGGGRDEERETPSSPHNLVEKAFRISPSPPSALREKEEETDRPNVNNHN